MDWYDILRSVGSASLTILPALVANVLGALIVQLVFTRRPATEKPPTAVVWFARAQSPDKGRTRITLLVDINRLSVVSLLLWTVLTSFLVVGIGKRAGDALRVVQPVAGEYVRKTFSVRGEAPGAQEGTIVYVVVRNIESPGELYVISDYWTVGANGWWQGVGRVPDGVPLHGRIVVHALSSSSFVYAPGQRFEHLRPSKRRGGLSDGIVVKYAGL